MQFVWYSSHIGGYSWAQPTRPVPPPSPPMLMPTIWGTEDNVQKSPSWLNARREWLAYECQGRIKLCLSKVAMLLCRIPESLCNLIVVWHCRNLVMAWFLYIFPIKGFSPFSYCQDLCSSMRTEVCRKLSMCASFSFFFFSCYLWYLLVLWWSKRQRCFHCAYSCISVVVTSST